jgi:hypothetical protein
MASTAQQECPIKAASILQQLKEAGQTNISDSLIQDWCLPLDPDPKEAAQVLTDHLKLLWTLLEHWKVSIGVTYNPLMAAFGYIYQRHEFGWKHIGGRSLAWPKLTLSSRELIQDSDDAKTIHILYKSLLSHSTALSTATVEFRYAMSYSFRPMPSWILPCDIADPLLNTPPFSRISHPTGQDVHTAMLFTMKSTDATAKTRGICTAIHPTLDGPKVPYPQITSGCSASPNHLSNLRQMDVNLLTPVTYPP